MPRYDAAAAALRFSRRCWRCHGIQKDTRDNWRRFQAPPPPSRRCYMLLAFAAAFCHIPAIIILFFFFFFRCEGRARAAAATLLIVAMLFSRHLSGNMLLLPIHYIRHFRRYDGALFSAGGIDASAPLPMAPYCCRIRQREVFFRLRPPPQR